MAFYLEIIPTSKNFTSATVENNNKKFITQAGLTLAKEKIIKNNEFRIKRQKNRSRQLSCTNLKRGSSLSFSPKGSKTRGVLGMICEPLREK